MAELLATRALPGEEGVIITDRTVNFGDVYKLGTLCGRKVEFSLVTENVEANWSRSSIAGMLGRVLSQKMLD